MKGSHCPYEVGGIQTLSKYFKWETIKLPLDLCKVTPQVFKGGWVVSLKVIAT